MGVSEIYLNFLRSPCLGRRGLQRLSLAPIAHFFMQMPDIKTNVPWEAYG